jgi:hypothetical protein
MRFSLALILLLSGCVTIVLPVREETPDVIARRTLRRGQREAEERQAELRGESLDALAKTAVRVASDVQAWALKPAAFGGGDGALDGVTLDQLGYIADGDRYHTLDGVFWLAPDSAAVLIHGESHVFGHSVTARVAGLSARDLSLTVRPR